MPDHIDQNSSYPQLPEEPPVPWLAANRRFAILGGLVIVLALVILILPRLRSTSPAGVANLSTVSISGTSTTNTASAPTFRRYTITPLPDQDHDGLTDAEETRLATKPTQADTDGDLLSDFDEVRVYHSDPLKPDTDGDGIPDGLEVRRGTNPVGAGQLYNVNQALQTQTK